MSAGGCSVDMLRLSLEDDHALKFDTWTGFAHHLSGSETANADGGYLLVRLDVDSEPLSVVNVAAPAGWAASEGRAPVDMLRRSARYLDALAEKIEKIEADQ